MDYTANMAARSKSDLGRPKSKEVKEEPKSLSQEKFERALKNPKLKYKGRRDAGESKEHITAYTKDRQATEQNQKILEQEAKKDIAGGYHYIAGFHVKKTVKGTVYLLTPHVSGDTFNKWKEAHKERIANLTVS